MMLQAVAHDIKNKLSELALCLAVDNPAAAEIAIDAAETLTQALMMDNDSLQPRIDAACPADLLEEIAVQYRQIFPNAQIQINACNAPSLWFYDSCLIRLTLSNAVHNALRFCRSTVCLNAREADSFLVFEVLDDGGGFPAQILETGCGNETSAPLRSHLSTGLGLLFSKRIAGAHQTERHGTRLHGWIELLNADGAVFRLGLP